MLNHQIEDSDHGWWALYNVLMLVHTGRTNYLNQFGKASRGNIYKLRTLFPSLTQQATIQGQQLHNSSLYEFEAEKLAIQCAIKNLIKEPDLYNSVSINKDEDISILERICKLIDKFNNLTYPYENYKGIFEAIGNEASSIRYNDNGEGCHEYIRNKYGSIDRTNNAKVRKGGLELIHLSALKYVSQKNPIINQNTYKLLCSDFKIIKNKIEGIISADQETKSLEDPQSACEKFKEATNFIRFVNYYYSKALTNEMLNILDDENLKTLNFVERDDRYYFGRILSMIGELSKDLRDFLNPSKEGGLFAFFKNIRDKRLAHSASAMVKDIVLPENQKQLDHFYFLLNVILLSQLRQKLTIIKQRLNPPFDFDKEIIIDLGATTEEQKQILTKLSKSIFKAENNEIDLSPLVTLNYKKKKTSLKIDRKTNITFSKNIDEEGFSKILNTIEFSTNKYYSSLSNANEKEAPEVISNRKKLIALVKVYNDKVSDKSKLISTDKIPTIEDVKYIISLNKTLVNISGEADVNKKQIEQTQQDVRKAVNQNKSIKSNKLKEKVRTSVNTVSNELDYVMKVLMSTKLTEVKKNYISQFALTKIGQLFKDVDKERKLIKLAAASNEHDYSVMKTVNIRHRLMHDILSNKNVSVSQVLFRETLPMIPEINALIEVLKNNSSTEGPALYKLGMAYLDLKRYDNALECFIRKLELSIPDILSIDNLSDEIEHLNDYPNFFNALTGIALTFNRMADNEQINGNNDKVLSLSKIVIRIYKNYLTEIKKFKVLEAIDTNIISVLNNLATVYSLVDKFEKAIKSHKEALIRLSKKSDYNALHLVTLLLNLGSTCVSKLERLTVNYLHSDSMSDEWYGIAEMAKTFLWESKIVFNKNKNEMIDSDHIMILQKLSAMMIFADNVYFLYAEEIFLDLKKIIKNFPVRDFTPEIISISEVDETLKYLQKPDVPEYIRRLFKTHRNAFDAKFDLIHIQNLNKFYKDLGVSINLKDRLDKAKDTLSKFDDKILADIEFIVSIGKLNHIIEFDHRHNKYQQVLKSCFKARKLINAYPRFKCEVLPILLENIGDTHRSLNNVPRAVEFFRKSSKAYMMYEPNNKFYRPLNKIADLNKKFDIRKNSNDLFSLLDEKLSLEKGDAEIFVWLFNTIE